MKQLAVIAAAIALAACSSAGPKTSEIISRAIPGGDGRLYVLREKQTSYSLMPLTISVGGRTVGTLRRGTYLATDLPAGEHAVTVALYLSRARTGIDLKPGETIYMAVAIKPSGLPPPRGAVRGAPRSPVTAEPSLFSIRFLDQAAARSALAGLLPSDR